MNVDVGLDANPIEVLVQVLEVDAIINFGNYYSYESLTCQ